MKIIFNHLEKTGGTTIHFLFTQIIKEEKYIRNMHRIVPEIDNVFNIISIRNPFNFYKSLYLYGCEGRGGLYKNIKKNYKNKMNFYNCTQAEYINFINFIYKENVVENYLFHELCGLFTRKFLYCSLLKKNLEELKNIKDYLTLKNYFLNKKTYNFIIKNETLISDIKKLILYLEKKPEGGLLKNNYKENFCKNINIKKNFTSEENKIKINNELLPSEIKNLIFEKEKLIFELFYPEILKDNY